MTSSTYNNNVLIVQTRDYVMLQTEMIHEARIVPADWPRHDQLRVHRHRSDDADAAVDGGNAAHEAR
jgi:hypothetical protein